MITLFVIIILAKYYNKMPLELVVVLEFLGVLLWMYLIQFEIWLAPLMMIDYNILDSAETG